MDGTITQCVCTYAHIYYVSCVNMHRYLLLRYVCIHACMHAYQKPLTKYYIAYSSILCGLTDMLAVLPTAVPCLSLHGLV